MAYDASKEKSLQKFEVADYKSKPEWGGSLVEVYEYEGKKKIRLQRYYFEKTGNKKTSNFFSIPASAEGITNLTELLTKIKRHIDSQKENTDI